MTILVQQHNLPLERVQDCWDMHSHLLSPEPMAARILLEARRMVQTEDDCLRAVGQHLLPGMWSDLPTPVSGLNISSNGVPLGWNGASSAVDQVVLRLWCVADRPTVIGRVVDERGWTTIDDDQARRMVSARPRLPFDDLEGMASGAWLCVRAVDRSSSAIR